MICATVMGPAMRRILEETLPEAKFPLSRCPGRSFFTMNTSRYYFIISIYPGTGKRNGREAAGIDSFSPCCYNGQANER